MRRRRLNRTFFAGILPADVPITLERTTPGCRGHFAPECWRRGGVRFGCIAIGYSRLGRGPEPVMAVLLHEMVHLRNWLVGLPDANPRNQYHSRNFRDVAVLSGLVCGKRRPPNGYAATELGEAGRRAIGRLRPRPDVFMWSVG